MVRCNVYEITTSLLLKTQTTPTSCLFYIARRIGWTLRLIEEKSLIIPNNYRRNCMSACTCRTHTERCAHTAGLPFNVYEKVGRALTKDIRPTDWGLGYSVSVLTTIGLYTAFIQDLVPTINILHRAIIRAYAVRLLCDNESIEYQQHNRKVFGRMSICYDFGPLRAASGGSVDASVHARCSLYANA